jgi:transposase-like protein
MVGMNEHTVAQWRRRFETERLAGLQDRKRPGRPLAYDHDQRLRLVATVTQEPPDPASHWSHSQLARALADVGTSASQVGRILADLGIKPHRVRSWITRPTILGSGSGPPTPVGRTWSRPPMPGAERGREDRHARAQPDPAHHPTGTRSSGRQGHEYVRHGTAILLAALDVHGGGIFTATDLDGNTAANFIAFLEELDAKVPAGLEVHLVLEGGSSHIARDTRWWFVDHPRFHPHYTQAMPRG